MNARTMLLFSKELSDCPSCGNEFVGTSREGVWQGKLIVEDEEFTRGCKCGYEITVSESEIRTRKQLKEVIRTSLEDK